MISAEGKTLYLCSDVGDENFKRECPQLWQAIWGRKYLLPQYRQNDYINQDRLNADMEFGLTATAMGALGYKDDVHHAQFANWAAGLWFERPTLWLEKELAGPLFASDPPKEMRTEDIEWKWPQFRVIVPKGLITIERGGAPRNVTFLDICMVPEEGIWLPPVYADEMEGYVRRHGPNLYRRVPVRNLTVMMKEQYLAVVAQIEWSEVGYGPTTYAYTVPWLDHTLGKLTSYTGGLQTAIACDQADNVLLDQIKRLSVNVLLFLSQKPFEYAPKLVRPFKREGKHHMKPALLQAHFVGREQFRKAAQMLHGAQKAAEAGGGVLKLKAHWRKGHWKRQPYGPKSGLRRWQWISIYHTFGHGFEELADTTAA